MSSDQTIAGAVPIRANLASDTPAAAVMTHTLAADRTVQCEDCRALTAFQAWRGEALLASFNHSISFASWNLVPPGRRAVIEMVTATIEVPKGEWARLRLFTSLGTTPSNLDLFMTHQGTARGREQLVATHHLR